MDTRTRFAESGNAEANCDRLNGRSNVEFAFGQRKRSWPPRPEMWEESTLRVGVDRQPAPVTDLMMTEVRPLPEWIFAIVKPPSRGGDAPDEGATAAGYGDTGELAAMSAPFCVVG